MLGVNKRPKHRHLIQSWQVVNSKNSGKSTTSSPTWNLMLQRRWAPRCSAEKALCVLRQPAGSCIYEERNQSQNSYEAAWRCEFRVCCTVFSALRMRRVMSYNLRIIICNCLHNKPGFLPQSCSTVTGLPLIFSRRCRGQLTLTYWVHTVNPAPGHRLTVNLAFFALYGTMHTWVFLIYVKEYNIINTQEE